MATPKLQINSMYPDPNLHKRIREVAEKKGVRPTELQRYATAAALGIPSADSGRFLELFQGDESPAVAVSRASDGVARALDLLGGHLDAQTEEGRAIREAYSVLGDVARCLFSVREVALTVTSVDAYATEYQRMERLLRQVEQSAARLRSFLPKDRGAKDD